VEVGLEVGDDGIILVLLLMRDIRVTWEHKLHSSMIIVINAALQVVENVDAHHSTLLDYVIMYYTLL
jgi:hypothetical protein